MGEILDDSSIVSDTTNTVKLENIINIEKTESRGFLNKATDIINKENKQLVFLPHTTNSSTVLLDTINLYIGQENNGEKHKQRRLTLSDNFINKNINIDKRTIIAWSGGLDSTYLLIKCLERGDMVLPIYYNILQYSFKMLADYIVRFENYLNLSKLYSNNLFSPIPTMSFGSTMFRSCTGFTQPQMLIHSISSLSDDILYNSNKIYIGYTMNDDIVAYEKELNSLYNNLMKFRDNTNNGNCFNKRSYAKLKFPLLKTSKTVMYYSLLDQYTINKSLEKSGDEYMRKPLYILSCENPELYYNEITNTITIKPCKSCVPCNKNKSNLSQLNESFSINLDNHDETLVKYINKLNKI